MMAAAEAATAPGTNRPTDAHVAGDAVAEPCLQLQKLERHLRDEAFQHETEDREDHTFNGIMVDLTCRDDLPCEYLEVRSVWVRGELGPLSVYIAQGAHMEVFDKPDEWTTHHKSTQEPSFGRLVELKLDPPVRIEVGQTAALYVHSALDGDQSIVYDKHRGRRVLYAPEGAPQGGGQPALEISPGLAHLSPVPFGGRAPWGSIPWRRSREFVGRVSYGVRWLCWNPTAHGRFPAPFQETVRTLLMCASRPESNLYHLRDEMIFFILNSCGWDWFGRGDVDGEGDGEEDPGARCETAGLRGGALLRRLLSLARGEQRRRSARQGAQRAA